MGVLECCRFDCPNIMCDTHVTGVGYICKECQEEFKNYMVGYMFELSDFEIKTHLEQFLETPKHAFSYPDSTVDSFFERYTK